MVCLFDGIHVISDSRVISLIISVNPKLKSNDELLVESIVSIRLFSYVTSRSNLYLLLDRNVLTNRFNILFRCGSF